MRARPSHSRRRWGLHLVRRNGIFQFRRRWPTALTKIGAPVFLSVSLRTDVLSEAVKRSAILLTIIKAGERAQIIAAQCNRNWELSAQLAASVAPQNGLSSEDITHTAVARLVLAVMGTSSTRSVKRTKQMRLTAI